MAKKQCPCCNAPQTFFSFKGQRIMLPCNNKENYKCLHCAMCRNQIGKPIHTVWYHLLIIGVLFASWWIASMIRQVFHLWDHYKGIFFDAPIMLIVYLVISYVVWYFTPLECTKISEKGKFGNADFTDIDNISSLTAVEKKTLKKTISITLLIEVVLLVIIAIGIVYTWLK